MSNAPVTLLGDFNMDLSKDNSFSQKMFLDLSLKQYVVSSTRITASSISLIDHVYSNDSNIDRVDVFSMLLADHMAQHCSLKQQHGTRSNQRYKYSMCRRINSLDENHIKTVLNDANWAASLAEQDINNAVSSFVKIFTAAWNKIAPIRSQRTRKRPNPWMPDELLDLLQRQRVAYKKFLSDHSIAKEITYKQIRNHCKSQVRIAKRQYFAEGAKKGGKFFLE